MPAVVREHPAPSGALRHGTDPVHERSKEFVREHPAPSGALRPESVVVAQRRRKTRQGAPSTIRCIKTGRRPRRGRLVAGQGAPSTIRCIKTRPGVCTP